jgi:hypothetical protein
MHLPRPVAKIRVLVAPALFWLEFTEDEDREALKSWEALNSYQITQDCDYQLFKFAFALLRVRLLYKLKRANLVKL